MPYSAALTQAGILVAAGTLTGSLGAYAYRNREEPGARPFVGLMWGLAAWSFTYATALLTLDPFWRMFLQRLMWLPMVSVTVSLLLFALAYTGHDEFVTRRVVGLLLVVPTAVVVSAWVSPTYPLLWTEQTVTVVDGLAVMSPTYGPVFWLQVVYSYGLVTVAGALLLRLIHRSDYLYADQSALLLIGVAAPFLTNVVDVFVALPRPGVDYTPHAFTITGLAFGYALFRHRLFDLVPATRQLGRSAAISQLEAGILIVDTERRIVYCNEAAGEILDCEPSAALGREARTLVDEEWLDFGADDALAEVERGDAVYEVRTSPITDRTDRRIGHTLVVHDVTARKRKERELAAQRDELERLDELNAVIRGVNGALVSAASREGIDRAVCEQLVEADRYGIACAADAATWAGEADRWFVASDEESVPATPALDDGLGEGALEPIDNATAETITEDVAADGGTWTVVPVTYSRTVYGAIGLYAGQEAVTDRERAVLGELGETVGHAINAVETRRLLSAEAVVEVELESAGDEDPLVAATEGQRLELAGIVPGGDDGHVAFLRVTDGDPAAVAERLDSVSAGTARAVDEDGPIEWQVSGEALVGTLLGRGAHVQRADVEGGRAIYEFEIASETDLRPLIEAIEREFPRASVLAKRERDRPVDSADGLPDDELTDLTDRQREALEAAYRNGYFGWPRDSTAEEVAETLDIAAPTFHAHIRKAEASLFADLFAPNPSGENT